MNERDTAVLEQYDFKVNKTGRGRGAILCDTDQGVRLLKEYRGSKSRIAWEEQLLLHIKNNGLPYVDLVLRNKDGELISTGEDGTHYIVKEWYYGRDCDSKQKSDIYQGAALLGKLHRILRGVKFQGMEEYEAKEQESLEEEYKRHTRELNRARTFMRKKRRKTDFELQVLKHYEEYETMAVSAIQRLESSAYSKLLKEAKEKSYIAHGAYHYHNIVILNQGATVYNFDRASVNLQLVDLYLFLRKVLEKQNWSREIGERILQEYQKENEITKEEWEVLGILLWYPEKFWKIVNHYYNGNKAWISEKNMEKLEILYRQNQQKREFLTNIFRI